MTEATKNSSLVTGGREGQRDYKQSGLARHIFFGVSLREGGRMPEEGTLTFRIGASQLSVAAMQSDVIQVEAGVVSGRTAVRARHSIDRGLLLIGLFKLGKALLFMGIGAGALHFIHKDLGDAMLRLAAALRFDPESRFVGMAMAKVDLIDHHRLREISMATFAYSALALTEGVGLMMQQVWAEFLTLGLTMSFLPWELYEMARHASWFRAALLGINLLVLGYLLWLVRRKRDVELIG